VPQDVGPERAVPVVRLKRRRDFERVALARRRWATPGLILQARPRPRTGDTAAMEGAIRVGFTVTRKVGNAVERNRVRRRLRAVAGRVLPESAAPGHDFVVVGRRQALQRAFADLIQDLQGALAGLGARRPG
jgi:ribonuclease P protein component